MIVCSCNVLSDTQILSLPRDPGGMRPCSPARAYRGLGCAPRCGRCVPTIRALLEAAHIAEASCRNCPAEGASLASEAAVRAMAPDAEPAIYRIAAE